MSKKKQAAYEREDAALAASMERTLTRLTERFVKAQGEKDPAKKILVLMTLDRDLNYTKYSIVNKVGGIAEKRGKRTGKTLLKRTGLTLATLTVVALPFTVVLPTWHSKKSVAQNLQELRARTDMDVIVGIIDGHRSRVAELLDQTVKGCDLREISKSPHYPDALHRNGALKRKFDAAAAARAALGDEQSPQASAAPEVPKVPTTSQTYPQL